MKREALKLAHSKNLLSHNSLRFVLQLFQNKRGTT